MPEELIVDPGSEARSTGPMTDGRARRADLMAAARRLDPELRSPAAGLAGLEVG